MLSGGTLVHVKWFQNAKRLCVVSGHVQTHSHLQDKQVMDRCRCPTAIQMYIHTMFDFMAAVNKG